VRCCGYILGKEGSVCRFFKGLKIINLRNRNKVIENNGDKRYIKCITGEP
jgi:hypothetical protein